MADSSSPSMLIERAKKLEKSQSGWMTFLFGGGPRYEEAADLYVLAANQYKLQRNWEEASNCHALAAHAQLQASDYNQVATQYVEAAHLAKKYRPQEAISYYLKAIELYNKQGRFMSSGKHLKGIAEIYEEFGDDDRTAEYYKKAADIFDFEEYGKSVYCQCILKYAEYSAKLGNLETAIQIFETQAERALTDKMITYSAPTYFFQAGILHLVVGDVVNCKVSFTRYDNLDPRFAKTRERKLLRELALAIEDQDTDGFVKALRDYDNISRLDSWKVHFLYQIKNRLPKSAGEIEERQEQDQDEDRPVDLT